MNFVQKINVRTDPTHTRARHDRADGGARVWWFGLRFALSITPPFYKLKVSLGAQPKLVYQLLICSQKLS